MRIQIQQRDRAILQAIYEHRFLPSNLVGRHFFRDVGIRRAQERIRELERAGLVRREWLVKTAGVSALRLTSDGQAVAEETNALAIPQKRTLNYLTYRHDSIVISTRFHLTELWNAVWIPEAALKQEDYPQIPDGVLLFPSKSRVAVEVEASEKGPKRFFELQERWRSVPVKLVLYVASTPKMFGILQGYLKRGPQDLPFGLIQWSDLEMRYLKKTEPQKNPLIWTVRGEIDLFSRREL